MLAGLSLLTFSVVNGTRRPAGHESKCRQCEDQAYLRTTWKEELQLLTRISSSNSIIFSLVSQAPLNPGRAFQVGLIRDSRFLRTNPTTGLLVGHRPGAAYSANTPTTDHRDPRRPGPVLVTGNPARRTRREAGRKFPSPNYGGRRRLACSGRGT